MSDGDLTVVSHEQDGKILSGVGVAVEDLQDTMARHAPAPPETAEAAPAVPASPSATTKPRDEASGQFTKPTRGQKRFDQLTAEREDARREAAEAKKERDEIKARLEAAERAPATPATAPSASVQPATGPALSSPSGTSETRPKPTESEVGGKYQSYADFVEDLADWKAEQRLAAVDFDARFRSSIEADRASRTLNDRVASVTADGKRDYPTFDADVKASQAYKYLHADAMQEILKLDGAHHVFHRLATDPDLAPRLGKLNAFQFGLEVAKLISASAVATPASTARPAVIPPPAPYQPVVGGGKTTVIPSADLAKNSMDYDASGYREQRARERAARR